MATVESCTKFRRVQWHQVMSTLQTDRTVNACRARYYHLVEPKRQPRGRGMGEHMLLMYSSSVFGGAVYK
eukprot:SAG11_NODE_21_length_25065_cov_3.589081_19_plen_70_part_00